MAYPSDPICIGCGLKPSEIDEYVQYGKANKMTPERFVIVEEGTYNPENGHFTCTFCYVKMGMPTAPGGWKAP